MKLIEKWEAVEQGTPRKAFNTLLEVCVNSRAPANARISAAQEILNRSSIGPVASRSMSIAAHSGIEELLALLDAQDGGGESTGGEIVGVTPSPPKAV